MKNLLFSIALLFIACKQNKTTASTTSKTKVNTAPKNWMSTRDSILYENEYGSIYFSRSVPERIIPWYQSDDSKDDLSQSFYTDFVAELMESLAIKKVIAKTDITDIIMNDLYLFNGKPCLYSPSDWFVTANYKFTDSTLFEMKSADPEFYFIQKSTQINAQTTEYLLAGVHYDYVETNSFQLIDSKLTVELINKENGIYLWTWITDGGRTLNQSLKVDSKNVEKFPVIIEDCGIQKCIFNQEYNFFSRLTPEIIKQIRN